MASIDVSADIQIAAEPTDVASVMFDPHREPEWISAVTRVEVLDPGIRPGARVRRNGRLAGQDIQWTTEVETFHFPHALTLRVVDGPFTGQINYQIQRAGDGSVVRIRNRGETTGFSFVPAALIEGPLRAALAGDLAKLKAIVEGQA